MTKLMPDLYHDPLTPEKATIKSKKKPRGLKQWDHPAIGSLVTDNERDPYHRVEPLGRWIAEQERQIDKPEPTRLRPGRSRRIV